ncbi:AMP-dependent synthetase/ligase [Pragia fontium]|uniref:Long-chain acyl-CoA synthetase n=2 Tax=Pragia fontium TaxID=82985 RepID=A0AAJ5BFQ9_9GAMM|nr:long-chain fatty acid--CoA ligase [Pragia fontium]AKJ41411.1 long-chain fatty acid--CoA ligase [Pragia fontium]SFC00296.1 long-chain acyl-CoA synthetase [Pragia fontium DSM 5563 = ATCC 49100]SUB81672.1 Long-chain-fatty-acid--CoA ligase FadD15 [Pragia fontium]VEJ54189.1 Long-chain-fatty-acid--CoA ligase FadD15 [Pragia fontium]GKX62972.1 long-chain-fatty-acid--CoA ligase [Pragia fontium]
MNQTLEQFHPVARVQDRIQQNPDRIAFREWHQHQENALSWQQIGERISLIARALLSTGVQVQDRVAIFATNSMDWAITDLSIQHLRAIGVPIYSTNTPAQSAFVINDAQARTLFVGAQAQMDAALTIRELCPQLERIIAFDSQIDLGDCDIAIHLDDFCRLADDSHLAELQSRIDDRNIDDLFTLIYTSGTTGEPKGVMLDYRNLATQFCLHDERLTVSAEDVSLSFLPLSHVFERAWSLYVMHAGAQNVYLRDTAAVREAMSDVKPTVMCAVPRFYEKVFSAIHDKVAQAPWHRRGLFRAAIWCGQRKFWAQHQGKSLNPLLSVCHRLADKLVLTKLRGILGGNVRFLPAAGAKLDDNIILFFHAVGLHITYGYGMTETCATVSCWEETGFRFGSIGRPLPGVDVRIGEENEIQIRGPIVMRGYYNRPQASAEAFTSDGWLKTGDAGMMDECGNLFITERIKDLMKTSCGKYIAPQAIEGALGQDRFIDQIAVVADARKFVSALIVPCFASLEEYAHSMNLIYKDRLELLRNSHIVELFEKRLNELQKELARFEQVKRFTLLPDAFSMEQGELTPTLKLRRKVILNRYQSEIEKMYRE